MDITDVLKYVHLCRVAAIQEVEIIERAIVYAQHEKELIELLAKIEAYKGIEDFIIENDEAQNG